MGEIITQKQLDKFEIFKKEGSILIEKYSAIIQAKDKDGNSHPIEYYCSLKFDSKEKLKLNFNQTIEGFLPEQLKEELRQLFQTLAF